MASVSQDWVCALDALINPATPPILDNIFKAFHDVMGLKLCRDRSNTLKKLHDLLDTVVPNNPTLNLHFQVLKWTLYSLKAIGNELRHVQSSSKLKSQLGRLPRALLDLGMVLDALIGYDFDLLFSYQSVHATRVGVYEIGAHFQLSVFSDPAIIAIRYALPATPCSRPSLEPSRESSIPATANAMIPGGAIEEFVPPAFSGAIPQGETMTFYKVHGFTKALLEKQLVFLDGVRAGRPCVICRYNGANTKCRFLDTNTIHFQKNEFRLTHRDL